jgi:hypothetical protein
VLQAPCNCTRCAGGRTHDTFGDVVRDDAVYCHMCVDGHRHAKRKVCRPQDYALHSADSHALSSKQAQVLDKETADRSKPTQARVGATHLRRQERHRYQACAPHVAGISRPFHGRAVWTRTTSGDRTRHLPVRYGCFRTASVRWTPRRPLHAGERTRQAPRRGAHAQRACAAQLWFRAPLSTFCSGLRLLLAMPAAAGPALPSHASRPAQVCAQSRCSATAPWRPETLLTQGRRRTSSRGSSATECVLYMCAPETLLLHNVALAEAAITLCSS